MRERDFYKIDLVPYAGCRLLHVPEPSLNVRFTAGKRIGDSLRTVELVVGVPGRAMDFSLTALGIPVVSEAAASLLARHAREDVQLFEARIASTSEVLKLV